MKKWMTASSGSARAMLLLLLVTLLATSATASAGSSSPSSSLEGCGCTKDLLPVCGTNGATYANRCLLRCAALRATSANGAELREAHEGRCAERAATLRTAPRQQQQQQQEGCQCTREFLLVCGTDGVTYTNACLLRCARGQGTSSRGAELELAHAGAC